MSAALLAAAALALAQSHQHHAPPAAASAPPQSHQGHDMPPAKPAPAPKPAAACTPEHAAMGHCTLPAPPASRPPSCPPEHAAMGHCVPAPAPAPSAPAATGTALPAGDAPAPSPPAVDYADRIWGRDAMVPARDTLYREHGGGRFAQLIVDRAEVRLGREDGYLWDGEAWYGGDLNRAVVRSEGEGSFREGFEHGEVEALWSRAIGPYFDLQAGVRQDFGPGTSPTHAVLGVEGLAPYWFEVEGALYLSTRGDLTARIEGHYDQRLTQRLILQPHAELRLAAQEVPETATGAGLGEVELGLRLRYEIAREFAPYVGVTWERALGDTARFARARGERASSSGLVAGIRFWF